MEASRVELYSIALAFLAIVELLCWRRPERWRQWLLRGLMVLYAALFLNAVYSDLREDREVLKPKPKAVREMRV